MSRPIPLLLAVLLASGSTASVAADPSCKAVSLDFGQPSARWVHQPLSKLKRDTAYGVVREDGRSVLRAAADRSASLYVAALDRLPGRPTTIGWRWKTDGPVPGADPRDKANEDAPLRVLVAFDGDPSTLPDEERKRFARAKALSGRAPPYAVVMYVWSDKVPVETVVPSAHTGQIRMLIAGSGTDAVGAWQQVRRDLVADFRRLYGAEPGRVVGVAVMTDTDNTGARAVGRYADIRLGCGDD
jgi:hypothetical protein